MPTTLHQGAARPLLDEPERAFACLRELFGLEIPALTQARDRHAALERFQPCLGDSGELRPDALLSADDPDDPHGGVGLIIEAQRRPDRVKHRHLWVYWALVSEYLCRSTAVMMIALSDEVSRWARRLDARELPPREALLVLDRHNMPVIVDPSQAAREPGWATLSALIHGVHGKLEPTLAALPVILELPDERRWRYASYMLCALDSRSRAMLREALSPMQRFQISDIERRSIAFHDGREEGRHLGQIEILRELVETILQLRGFLPSPELRAAIRASTHLGRLLEARSRAKEAQSLDEVNALERLLLGG
ncbi:hypothetical protein PPSIR1_25936 [Plesiocystis pacifica SIR-1]|uniref:Uncharacterized protein n=1 Tax=Plesiocystis pacifica SIR-1 TaxID=391625 RepID=A6FZK1_9BACT|nr:hypothetical protein [Plesiocystis pacifica]EDM81085.1 hypothetical protein PPSIR1_25936 [Plesiocystis pacifica SIR-1]